MCCGGGVSRSHLHSLATEKVSNFVSSSHGLRAIQFRPQFQNISFRLAFLSQLLSKKFKKINKNLFE